MIISKLVAFVGLIAASHASLSALANRQSTKPLGLPFHTEGRDIIKSDGSKFLHRGTNWPGHQEAMIPEGLQYSSVKDIVAWIPRLGLNTVRLTYATQMIDDIISNNPNQTLERSLINGLGSVNGTKVLEQVLSFNPQFTKDTTRLQVFDDVATELARQGVLIQLDNHVSEAFWCCGENDGNGWFGEKFFIVPNWIRGWEYIAKHAAERWPTFSGVGLRNELRNSNAAEPVDWYTWYVHMTAAADAVHKVAPDVLITFSGLSYDTYIDPIPLGKRLNGTANTATAGKTALFDPSKFAYKNKIILEIHKYDFEKTQDNCDAFTSKWYTKGFQSVNAADPATKYLFPMVISEWGFLHDGKYYNESTYARCLVEMVKKYQVGWMQWELSGSFYIQTRPSRTPRSIQDLDEAWGLLNHNWTAVRSQVTLDNSLFKMIEAQQV